MTYFEKTLKKYSWITLILIGLLSGLLWRLEIEYYGWNTLKWYYTPIHISPIVSLVMLIGWFHFTLTGTKKAFIYIGGIGLASVLYIILPTLIRGCFPWVPLFPPLVICNIPLGAFLILKIFGEFTSFKKLLVSYSLMIVSFPATVGILMLIEQTTHIGGSDVYKSGFLIPFWIISLGNLIINRIPSDT